MELPARPHTPHRGSQPEAVPCRTALLATFLHSHPLSFSPHKGFAPLPRPLCDTGVGAPISGRPSPLPPHWAPRRRLRTLGGRQRAAGAAPRRGGPGVAPRRAVPFRAVPRGSAARPPPRLPPLARALCKMAAAAERGADLPAEPPRGARPPPPLSPEEVARRLASTRRELSNRRKILLRNLPAESSSQVRPPPPLSRRGELPPAPQAGRGGGARPRAAERGRVPRGSRSPGPAGGRCGAARVRPLSRGCSGAAASPSSPLRARSGFSPRLLGQAALLPRCCPERLQLVLPRAGTVARVGRGRRRAGPAPPLPESRGWREQPRGAVRGNQVCKSARLINEYAHSTWWLPLKGSGGR